MKTRIAPATALAVLLIAGSVASAQTGSVSGTVLDRATRKPIKNAWVSVTGTNVGVNTKENGAYTLTGIPSGVRTIHVSRSGYKGIEDVAVAVNSGDLTKRNYELVRDGEESPTRPTLGAPQPRIEPPTVGGPPTKPPVPVPPIRKIEADVAHPSQGDTSRGDK